MAEIRLPRDAWRRLRGADFPLRRHVHSRRVDPLRVRKAVVALVEDGHHDLAVALERGEPFEGMLEVPEEVQRQGRVRLVVPGKQAEHSVRARKVLHED